MSVNIYNKTTNSLTKIAGNAVTSGEPVSLDNYYTKTETENLIADTLSSSTLTTSEVETIFNEDD